MIISKWNTLLNNTFSFTMKVNEENISSCPYTDHMYVNNNTYVFFVHTQYHMPLVTDWSPWYKGKNVIGAGTRLIGRRRSNEFASPFCCNFFLGVTAQCLSCICSGICLNIILLFKLLSSLTLMLRFRTAKQKCFLWCLL